MLGVVNVEQLAHVSEAGRGHETVESVLGQTFVHVHPDHPLDVVLERLAESPELLPVVGRAAVRRVEGVITPTASRSLRGGLGPIHDKTDSTLRTADPHE
jgi:hypothetical protein